MTTDSRNLSMVAMMREPAHWPVWPLLPVKKATDRPTEIPEVEQGSVGVIAAGRPTVFIINMMAIPAGYLRDTLKDVPRIEYESFEEIVEAGWVVD